MYNIEIIKKAGEMSSFSNSDIKYLISMLDGAKQILYPEGLEEDESFEVAKYKPNSLLDFFEEFCEEVKIEPYRMKSLVRNRILTDHRCVFVALATKLFKNSTQNDIANLISRDRSMIPAYMKEVKSCHEKRQLYKKIKRSMNL